MPAEASADEQPATPPAVAGRRRGPFGRAAGWRLAALAVLALGGWGALRQGERAALPAGAAAGLSWPQRVAGVRVESLEELAFQVQRLPPGTALPLEGRAEPLPLPAEVGAPGLLLTLLGVGLYAALLAVVVAPRASQPAARALGAALVAAGLAIGLGGVYPATTPLERLATCAYALALSALPVAFLRLASTFPRPSAWLDARPWTRWGLLLAALAPAGAWAAAVLRYDALGTPEAFAAVRAAQSAQRLLLLLGMAAGLVALLRAARGSRPEAERHQARWLLGGIAVAVAPFLLLRTLPRLLGVAEPPVPAEVDRLVELAAPLAFAVAIARHRLFDIDAVLRRHLIAGGLALALACGVVAALLGLGRAWLEPRGLPQEVGAALAGAVGALSFLPLRRAAGRWVDRVFFRIRHGHGLALNRLEGALARARTFDEAGAALREALREQLGPERVGVWLESGDATPPPCAPEELPRLAEGRVRARPEATALADLPAGLPACSPPGTSLVQPAAARGRLWGLLTLGPRPSGHRYVEEDLAFLAGVAERAARAAERLHLLRSLESASAAREALAALDRQRRDFLLRVAHDLRTPLTAVRWSAENLRDAVGGSLSPAQAEQVGDILAAGGRLTRLVENLLALSRLELGEPAEDLGPVDAGAALREVAASQRALARAKQVDLVLRGTPAPPVRARRDGLEQVVQNLLDNAIRYAPPGSTVEMGVERGVHTGAEPGPEPVRLWVRDHGPGFGDRDPEGLFGLFRQGAPSPHAAEKGFGVGLHVVRSWVEAFGGSVAAAPAPGGGALFTCTLPAAGAPGASA